MNPLSHRPVQQMTLRSQLNLLALGVLAPLVVLAGLAAFLLVQQGRTAMEAEAIGRVRATVSAVDAELKGHIATVEGLAASRSLENGDLRSFHDEMVRVLKTEPRWLSVGLASAAGERLADAVVPLGDQIAPLVDRVSFDRAVRTAKPQVGSVALGAAVKVQSVRVRVPVILDGKVRYVVSVPLRLQLFEKLLREQRVPDDWVIVLIGADRRFIARIPSQPPGAQISASFSEALDRSTEGFFRGQTVEGFQTYTPYATSAFSGWVVGIAIPQYVVEGGARDAAMVLGVGFVLALAAALWLSWWIGRRIERPITELAQVAAAMQTGQSVDVPRSSRIAQISALASVLQAAAGAMRERETLLQREKAALQQSDRAKDEFIAMLSHELRNPLAALMSASEVLKIAPPESEAALKSREVVARQTKQMARLVEDLLDVSRIATGKVWLTREPINLADPVNAAVTGLRAAARLYAHDVQLELHPAWLSADRARIEQIATNLVDNAVKYSPAGRRIDVIVRQEAGEAVLIVSDEGEGIAKDALEKVFDLFAQGEQDLARQKGGMGLGLAIVKRLVELHGGEVYAQSAGLRQGATFTVRFPAIPPQGAQPQQLPAGQKPAHRPRRILLVEDNDDVRETLRAALALSGHEVQVAASGEQAFERAQSVALDVALIDLGLPDVDGFVVAQRLRQAFPSAMLVALTGYGQPHDAQRVRAAGFDLHLVKPVSAEELNEAIAVQG